MKQRENPSLERRFAIDEDTEHKKREREQDVEAQLEPEAERIFTREFVIALFIRAMAFFLLGLFAGDIVCCLRGGG